MSRAALQQGGTEIKKTITGSSPSLPYEALARRVLGSSYELSVVICGDALARKTNKTYRGKTYAANVLSFPYSKNEGELFLNPRAAKREAAKLGVSYRSRLALLFVHGLFHLKGYAHGRTMEDAEQQVLSEFHLR